MYRRALDNRNVIQIYPDGFLPISAPDVTDYSAAIGYAWTAGSWDLDASLVYGYNEMQFTIENTLNRSLGTASKTVFDAGGFEVAALASPLNVAIGIEARRDNYSITAGEPDSYRNGGVLLNGAPTASGSQVFPGFRPANEVDEDRTAVGAYVDVEANLTDKLLASAAVRAEDYSDFGSNVSGKLAVRYDFTENFALRGAAQNGFRAPSLQQQYFATTSTNFINGVPFDITTFPVSDPVAIALGAKPLDAEKSVNGSLGAVFRVDALSVTIDAYRINIDDRIVLSENLTQANVRNFLTSQGFIGIGGGRFFINGVDTETTGVDIVATFPVRTEAVGRFDFTLGANFNRTKVTRVPTTAPLAALSPSPVLFDRVNVLTFEKGTPDDKFTAQVNWSLGGWSATLRATQYGEVLDPGTTEALDFRLPSATLVDLEGRYSFNDRIKVAIGAENLFDEYPEAFLPARNTTGNTPFSNYSPFGRSGPFLVSWPAAPSAEEAIRDERVVRALCAERRRGPVAGQKRHVVAERKELLANRMDQLRVIALREIRAADRAGEQHVADDRKTRAAMEVHDVAGRVTRAVPHLEQLVAHRHGVAVVQPARRREALAATEAEHPRLLRHLLDPE